MSQANQRHVKVAVIKSVGRNVYNRSVKFGLKITKRLGKMSEKLRVFLVTFWRSISNVKVLDVCHIANIQIVIALPWFEIYSSNLAYGRHWPTGNTYLRQVSLPTIFKMATVAYRLCNMFDFGGGLHPMSAFCSIFVHFLFSCM